MWSRIHLIPLLTAEEDRDLVRRHLADQAREKELLGSETNPYNSDRYVRFCSGVEMEGESGGIEGTNANTMIQIRTTNIRHHAQPSIKVNGMQGWSGTFILYMYINREGYQEHSNTTHQLG
jgi:hypothetical protein